MRPSEYRHICSSNCRWHRCCWLLFYFKPWRFFLQHTTFYRAMLTVTSMPSRSQLGCILLSPLLMPFAKWLTRAMFSPTMVSEHAHDDDEGDKAGSSGRCGGGTSNDAADGGDDDNTRCSLINIVSLHPYCAVVIRILARLCLAASAETLNRKPKNAQNRSLWQEEVFSLVAKPVIEDATQHRHLRAMGMVPSGPTTSVLITLQAHAAEAVVRISRN